MGPTADYKKGNPDGYTEHVEYVDGDSKINTPEWKVGEVEDIKVKGKELASESEHQKILYPNADSLKAPEKEEKAKGIYMSNMTGDVPESVEKPSFVQRSSSEEKP